MTDARPSQIEGSAPTEPSPLRSAGELVVLSIAECAELLRKHRHGRFVFAYESWPVVMPVNYAFEDPTVVIRTGLGAKLSASPFHAVAFEIDDADSDGQWGWSVLVQGPAFDITSAMDDRSKRMRDLPVAPWAPGIHDHWLTITAIHLTGRRFGHVPERDRSASIGANVNEEATRCPQCGSRS